ncbi:MAG: GNAT family N-acetyltransferase [Oscillospiraceae bacterium]|nr:GNAT family N-acetyltransferase [Oscillospiraceae bacterium]
MMQTKRLILRPWQEADAESLYAYAKDPDIGLPAGWPPHKSVEDSREVIRYVLSAPQTYAVCLKDGSPIGSISLKLKGSTDMTDREDECELGYWIGKPFWGQGLIPEAAEELLRHAFEELGMRAVWCGYYEGNVKSRRVQEKLGFVYQHTTEGLELPLLGERRTGHTMLLTKERWKNLR